jgi:hypothetical protein
MTTFCGDSSTAELPLFQGEDGGATPTSPLQLHFREINAVTAAGAYRRWHYLGDTQFLSQINFGAYFEGQLQGSISYGPPNAKYLKGFWTPETQNDWWEIKRLAMSDLCPRNSESRFIAVTLRLIKKTHLVRGVITYADDGQGHVGTIYRASGFTAMGLTAQKTDFYIDGKIKQRGRVSGLDGEWRPRSRKWLFVKRFDPSHTVLPIGAKNQKKNTYT